MSYGKPPASHPVAAEFPAPLGVVVARAPDGLNGLRHPTAVLPPERPNLGLQQVSQQGPVNN